jgi:hypothetical protein
MSIIEVEVEVTLRLTVSQSVCLGIEHHCGTSDQILLLVGTLLSEICGLVSVGRPVWREDRSAVCSIITQWSESRRTRNDTLLSHLRLSPTWRARFPYLCPPGTGWASYRFVCFVFHCRVHVVKKLGNVMNDSFHWWLCYQSAPSWFDYVTELINNSSTRARIGSLQLT